MRKRQSGVASIGLHLFASIMFASLFAMSAGHVYAVASYSDSWLDDSNPSAGHIVACGVTRSAYNYRWSAIHEVQVETTLTSPRGRRVTAEGEGVPHSNYGTMTARAEAVLSIDFREKGNFRIKSRHYSECPEVEFGYTQDILPIGVSFSCYRIAGAAGDLTGIYRVINNCDCSCKAQEYRYTYTPTQRFRNFLVVAEPYVITPFGNVCNRIIGAPEPSNYCDTCFDIDLP
jgi:hypothetical protein